MSYLNPEYDLIVAGAGPAGIAAAITASKKGLAVLLINPDEPATKNTIESVHSGVAVLLESIGCVDCLSAAIIGEYEGIESAGKIYNLGGDAGGSYKGYHIDREAFDKKLVARAGDYRMDILSGIKVKKVIQQDDCITGVVTDSGREIICKYVIDASGFKRLAGKQFVLKEEFFSPPLTSWSGCCYGIEPDHALFKNTTATFIRGSDGWVWLAPILPDKCAWTQLSAKGKTTFLPPDTLRPYPFDAYVRKSNRRWSIYRPLYKKGIILCGEAASIIDPSAGQGVLQALHSGIKSAHTVTACLKTIEYEDKILLNYDNWMYKTYMDSVSQLSYYYNSHGIDLLT